MQPCRCQTLELRILPQVRTIPAAAIVVRLRVVSTLALLCVLAACAGHYRTGAYRHGDAYAGPSRYYPPPGPADDPWGPYVRQASSRFGIPEQWIREVMRQESNGREGAVSSAGAMGLMQIMPDTYDDLRQRYALGRDPFEPRNNIMAGAAYIREMADRYGNPGFLAAYNAGPSRLDSYLVSGEPLPDETTNYVASVAPRLGGAGRTGPLAVYAQGGRVAQDTASPVPTDVAGACDPNAAYDPDRSCVSAPALTVAPVVLPPVDGCDPDAAYDPSRHCTRATASAPANGPAVIASRSSLYEPPRSVVSASASALDPPTAVASAAVSGGGWAIQVGAFSSLMLARAVAVRVHDTMPDLLSAAQIELLPTSPFGGKILYRARLSNISAHAASAVCDRLAAEQQPCMVVTPGQAS